MSGKIINLKQRIDKNYKSLQRKYLPAKILLKKIDELISSNASGQKVTQWLKEHDNIIFSLEYHLKNLEENIPCDPVCDSVLV